QPAAPRPIRFVSSAFRPGADRHRGDIGWEPVTSVAAVVLTTAVFCWHRSLGSPGGPSPTGLPCSNRKRSRDLRTKEAPGRVNDTDGTRLPRRRVAVKRLGVV